jgi:hypothetical protein
VEELDRLDYITHIRPHFMALIGEFYRRVLERDYPEGWGATVWVPRPETEERGPPE